MSKKKSSTYWKKRFSELENANNQYGLDVFHQIEPAFDQAQRQIQAEIEAWYMRYAKNNGITMVEARKQLSAAELKELQWDVQEYIKYGKENAMNQQWMKELENASARFHVSRLEALKLRTQNAFEVAFGNELDSVDKMLKNLYQSDYYHTCFEVQKGFNLGWEIGQIDERKLQKIIAKPWASDGKNFSDRIWTSKTKMVNELHQQMTRNILQGKAPDQAIKHMTKFIKDRTKNAKYNAGRLVMTEQAFISSSAQKDAFIDLDVEEFEIVATLDSHTSDICRDMDGQHFMMKDYEIGVTAPPFHVWCRSCTVPYFDDEWGRSGERAARGEDGKTYYVPSNMTYHEWEKAFVDGNVDDLQVINSNDTIKKKVKSIDDCNTTEEVVDLFKSHKDWFYEKTYPDGKIIKSIDNLFLNDVDLESAKTVYRPFEKVFEKYPSLKGKLNAVNSASLSSSTYAQCSYGLGHGGIAVNTKFYGNYDKLVKSVLSDEKAGYHPKGLLNPDSVVMHELGHAIDDYLSYCLKAVGMVNSWKPKTVSAYLRPKVMKATGFKVSDIYTQVSGYATKDSAEWFAECFAEYMLADEPRPVAKEFGKQLEEIMKGCGLL